MPDRRSRFATRGVLTLVVAAALATAACHSAPRYPGASPTTSVIVDNTRANFGTMTIHLITPDGGRMSLGRVNPDESRTFRIRRTLRPGDYRLEARGTRRLRSGEFRLDEGDVMEWNLWTGEVRFRGKGEYR